MQTRVSCAAPRRIRQRTVRVEQAPEFDDSDKDGEEEKSSYCELGYRRAFFTPFEYSIRQASPPPFKGCSASLCWELVGS